MLEKCRLVPMQTYKGLRRSGPGAVRAGFRGQGLKGQRLQGFESHGPHSDFSPHRELLT